MKLLSLKPSLQKMNSHFLRKSWSTINGVDNGKAIKKKDLFTFFQIQVCQTFTRLALLTTSKKRLYDLNSYSSTPTPFKLVYSCRVDDAEGEEKNAHSALAESRINKKREFFKSKSKIELVKQVRDSISHIQEEDFQKGFQKDPTRRVELNF